MQFFITLAASVLVFGAAILFHEMGHFVTAKKCGIQVNEFSIGMGPALFKRQKGGTVYSLRLLPIGGYVSMEGEDGDEEPDPDLPEIPPELKGLSFGQVTIPRRMLVVAAGAIMNFILGFLVMLVLVCGQDQIVSRQIHSFTEDAKCAATGLQVDDVILKVNGRRCFIANDIVYELVRSENYSADFTVRRDGKTVEVPGVQFDTVENEDGSTGMVLGFIVYGLEKTPWNVLCEAGNGVLYYGRVVVRSLVDLAVGRADINDLSGPVGIISAIGEAASYGWRDLLSMMALLTVNLGVFNLLPLPALDGGRIALLALEGVRGKPLSPKIEEGITMVGMSLLLTLMFYVTAQDIGRILFD
ncbi:MAG: site-2 protease family protein [Oscillospiraceae bacterium]|nr:site-2 protease family protein [Oscillospiraceae bacterium]